MGKPYGATHSDGRYERFITATGWKYVSKAHCLHWVSTGYCRKDFGICSRENNYDWMDHVSGYIRKTEDGAKERLLLCQPYQLNHPETLIAAADEFNLEFGISGRGWYGHGTVTIELTPRGQRAREYARALEQTREQARERAATMSPVSPTYLDKVLMDWDED
jgi:hypothetical protein